MPTHRRRSKPTPTATRPTTATSRSPHASTHRASRTRSDPCVTGVGGTSTAISQAGVTGETGWQTTKYTLVSGAWAPTTPFLYGGGGGYSSNIAEPDYQVAAGIHSPNGGRALPDVAMDG